MDGKQVTTGVTVVLAAVIAISLSTGMVVASPDRLPLDSTHLEGTELDQPANTTHNLTSTTRKEITTTSTGDIPTKIGDITYASENSVSINEMIATDDGNYLLVGGNYGDTEIHPSVRKVTADGSVLWERTYPDEYNQSFTSVIQTESGNFVLSGVTETADSYTGLGVKIDSEGTKLWEIEGGLSEEVFRDVEQTTANRYLFVSEYNSSEGDENAGVLKTTADGEKVWRFNYWDRSERNDQGFSGIERVEPDRFALVGDAYIDDQLDAWAFEIDSNGEILSSETFGHPTLNDHFNDITITTDNNLVYVGFRNGNYDTTADEYISSDAWIYYDGFSSWSKDVAVDNINVFNSVSTDGDRIVAGGKSGPEADANRNRLAVEYDTGGTQNWVLNGEETGDQSIDTVLVDGSDTYLAGEEQAPDADTYDGKLFRYTSPLLRYAGPSGVVGPGGLGDAAADFRAGKIGPGTLGEVAAAFRSGEPVV